ncbi:MAG: hypothetical protein J5781_00065 [Clostridia bacterium]|nr:hypothetical protein [Clostridia bacterium]
MKTPVVRAANQRAQDRPEYQAAQGIEQANNAVDSIVARSQRLAAVADMAELKTGLSAWITEYENKGGDFTALPAELNKEIDNRMKAFRNKGGYYAQSVEEEYPLMKVELSSVAENAVVNAMLRQNRENISREISSEIVSVRRSPEMLDDKINKMTEEINKITLSPKEKASLIEKMKADMSLAVMDEDLKNDPKGLAEKIRSGAFKDYASVERQDQYLKAAEKETLKTAKSSVYAQLYENFKDEKGNFDYSKAVLFLRKPENQKELGLTAEAANSVADMLYSQFTQEAEMRERARSESATAEIDLAIDAFYKGNAAAAIQTIQDSETIKGTDKMSLIEKLKNNKFGTESDYYKEQEIAGKIARREINSDEELISLVAKGEISDQVCNKARTFLKNRDEKAFSFVQSALEQIKATKGLLGKLSPEEAAQNAAASLAIMEMWNDAVKNGYSIEDVAKAFSPENIEKIRQRFSVTLEKTIESKMSRYSAVQESTVKEAETIIGTFKSKKTPQRKPNETIEEYRQRVKK